MKRRAALAAALILPAAMSWGGQQPSPPENPAVTAVTIDPQLVRLPVRERNDIRFVRMRRSQGLSQQRVTSIAQDGQGFLWFGTQYGLDRYDGYRFKIFKNDPNDPGSLCGVAISSLLVDRAGRLWIGCDYALDRYDPITETFVHYQLAPFSLGRHKGHVRHIAQDRYGILWLSTEDGLYRLDPTSGATARFGHDKTNPFSLSSNDVRSSGEDRAGTFWVATRNGIDAFDRKRGRVTEHVPLFEARDFSFYEDRQGVFWVLYASGNGLAVLDRKTHHLTRYSFGRDDLSTHPLTGVSSMLEDRDGNLWIGTFSDGLLRFDREHRRFLRYRNNPLDSESISENRITTLFEDREGDIWLGLGANEPASFPITPPRFAPLPHDSGDPDNLGETLVNTIYEDRAGILWMGTTGALVRLDRQNQKLTHFAIPGGGVASDVLAILEDSSGALWIGTSGQGLYRRSSATGRLTAFRHRNSDSASLSDDTVFQIFRGRGGTIWVTTAHGLDRFNVATGTFTTFRYAGTEDPGSFGDVVEDANGALWVGTEYSGVLRFDVRTGRFAKPGKPRGQNEPSYARVNGLLLDHAGDLWAATQNGVDRYDRQMRRVTHYSEENGLASNDVSCILEDSTGALWMSTSSGISHLDPERKHFSNYSEADGLPGPDFTGYRACFRSSSGEMFFGGFSGAVAVRPEKSPEAAYVPPVVLTSFQLFGKPVALVAGSPLKRAIDQTEQLTLFHQQNSFSFEFAALSFRNSATNRYRFKLEGLDEYWQEVGSDRRYATYTALPAGKYLFRVQGATIRGAWSEPGVAVQVTIMPPWWQTWWFRALSGILIFIAAVALYASHVRKLRRQFDIRLQARDSERARIARELHDSLLQGYQGLLFRLQAARNLLPGRPQAAAGVLETAMELGDKAMSESREAVQDLRASTPASNLADSLAELGDELALHGQDGGATYDVLVYGRPQELAPLVRDEMYRIAREAVRNAAAHARARRIEAELNYGTTELSLRVRDDGVGIDPQTLEHWRAGHWGLQGMRERAESFGARFSLWSESGVGTEIELVIPAAVCYAPQKHRTKKSSGKP